MTGPTSASSLTLGGLLEGFILTVFYAAGVHNLVLFETGIAAAACPYDPSKQLMLIFYN